jgi:hypothetical protein
MTHAAAAVEDTVDRGIDMIAPEGSRDSLKQTVRQGKDFVMDKTSGLMKGQDLFQGGDQDRGSDSALSNPDEMDRLKRAAKQGKELIKRQG